MELYVCECTLFENPRMTSTYLVLAANKQAARKMMQDGEHRVHSVRTYGSFVYEIGSWDNLSTDQEEDLLNGKPVCLVAGT